MFIAYDVRLLPTLPVLRACVSWSASEPFSIHLTRLFREKRHSRPTRVAGMVPSRASLYIVVLETPRTSAAPSTSRISLSILRVFCQRDLGLRRDSAIVCPIFEWLLVSVSDR